MNPDDGDNERDLWKRWGRTQAPLASLRCPDAGTLASYLDGRLRPREAEALSQHLVACDGCLRAVQELRGLLQQGASSAPTRVVERAVALVPPSEKVRPASEQILPARTWLRWAAAIAAVSVACWAGFAAGYSHRERRERIGSTLRAICAFETSATSGVTSSVHPGGDS